MVSYAKWELYVGDLQGKMDRGELIPDPDWQRGYIWKAKDEELLIDSILRDLPIPKFYLTREYDAEKSVFIHYVVDGQQRIQAIYKFLTNRFPVPIEGKSLFFKKLDKRTQEKITGYKLDGHYLVDYTQADINFLFERLNTTGIKLNNMEVWNSKYSHRPILEMVNSIYEEHKGSYVPLIYTEENVARKLPLEDILDLSNCLFTNRIEGGTKKALSDFLTKTTHPDISKDDSAKIRSRFRKVVLNINEIFDRETLVSSSYSKRTHFLSLFLAVGLLIPDYYILNDPSGLREALLEFIESPPDEYKKSALGAIRQKAKRDKRVDFIQEVVKRFAIKLDEKRLFDEPLRQRFWRTYGRHCSLCSKPIGSYKDACVDHKEPWAKGGRTDERNAQLAHRRCNQKKRDTFEEYIILGECRT
jgi:5-methylcytosine-specific restriction endonuclease McrA